MALFSLGGRKLNWAWIKGKKKFLGRYGTRDGYARDLLVMGDIKLTKTECKKLDIQDQSEVCKISVKAAREVLQGKGFSWQKIDGV